LNFCIKSFVFPARQRSSTIYAAHDMGSPPLERKKIAKIVDPPLVRCMQYRGT